MPMLLLAVLLAMTIGPAVQAQPQSCLRAGRQTNLQDDCAAKSATTGSNAQAHLRVEIIAPIPTGSMHSSPEEQSASQPAASAQTILDATCRLNWRHCADNTQMVNTYSHWRKVRSECRSVAAQLMRHGEPNFPWFAFRSFLQGDDYPRAGIVTVIEPRAQFRNGLGAVVNGRVMCRYDLRSSQVLDVQIL